MSFLFPYRWFSFSVVATSLVSFLKYKYKILNPICWFLSYSCFLCFFFFSSCCVRIREELTVITLVLVFADMAQTCEPGVHDSVAPLAPSPLFSSWQQQIMFSLLIHQLSVFYLLSHSHKKLRYSGSHRSLLLLFLINCIFVSFNRISASKSPC